jgi:predicted amidohydrolase YtcJ
VIALLAGFLLLGAIASPNPDPPNPPAGALPAPLLLENGVVYVSADAKPVRASVLLEGGKIAFVGDPARAKELGRGARVLDLKGRFVFPGWADAHLHLLGVGKALAIADLRAVPDAGAAAGRMADTAKGLPPGTWVEGRGWDQNHWPGREFPDARVLDRAIPDRPAVAGRVDGHAFWVNSAALRAAGIDAATKDPEGGRILRRGDGTPTGVLVDNDMDLVARAMPPPTGADLDRWLSAGAGACARVGLTEIQDASGYDAAAIASLERLASSGRLPIRVYATVSPDPAALPASLARGPRLGGGADFLTVRAVKAYADGALGSRGAALLTDYTDEAGKTGLLVTSPERLAEIARETRTAGWQLWIHAIGDRGNRIALDAFASAAADVPQAPAGASRPRIEHAQVVAPEDFARFARLSVIASVQPTHATSDMPWAEARLGPARVTGAYAWRRLKDAGARLAGGSDAPVESENPLLGFYSAVTRQSLDGQPPGGWRPSEKLSRAEALALFTSDAAWAAFEESWRGRIDAGYAADLTVLSEDPVAVPAARIPGIAAVLTLVGGRIAHGPAAP